jgi:hypothetical protein
MATGAPLRRTVKGKVPMVVAILPSTQAHVVHSGWVPLISVVSASMSSSAKT